MAPATPSYRYLLKSLSGEIACFNAGRTIMPKSLDNNVALNPVLINDD